MILPSKHLPQDRALLTVGGHVLTFLARPKTVSALWEELNQQDEGGGGHASSPDHLRLVRAGAGPAVLPWNHRT